MIRLHGRGGPINTCDICAGTFDHTIDSRQQPCVVVGRKAVPSLGLFALNLGRDVTQSPHVRGEHVHIKLLEGYVTVPAGRAAAAIVRVNHRALVYDERRKQWRADFVPSGRIIIQIDNVLLAIDYLSEW